MKAFDFIYDNKKLSSFDMIICNFEDKGLNTIENGAAITFNTVATLGGLKHELVSSSYDSCLETTIQICKNPCVNKDMEIPNYVFREITKWLCRKKFLKLKFVSEDYIDLYYEAKIDINKIELDGKLVGLELNIITNSPHAFQEPKTIVVKNSYKNWKHSISDISHEEGYIYPYTEITIEEGGDLNIHNDIENRDTFIANCVAGEKITMDYPVIQSSISSHNIQNDFNWNFFRIANTYENSKNDLTISIPCTIKIKYSPIVKIGL